MNPQRVNIRTWISDFTSLFVPRRCAGCDTALLRFEECLCHACVHDLPFTYFHEDAANRVEQLFWGKTKLEAASALLHFAREGMVQRMLHRIKYGQDSETGLYLGRSMGEALATSARFSSVDTILAVPLHKRKQRSRGYNQSQLLVDGIREVWPKDAVGDELMRVVRTPSQTKRGRMDRWLNVKEAFHLPDPEALRGRHVLIVDDVVTTGATIEGCVRALDQVPDLKVSLFTAACA
ncbi:MAG TPA: phosphoribosyltransferase family protein [Flavobacteriales bacterium]|nr:phosphoribosyltransferase family protein [Flavobacteriales bacterium]